MRRISLTKHALALGAFLACSTLGVRCDVVPAAAADDDGNALGQSFALEARGDLTGALAASERAVRAQPELYFAALRVAYLELQLKNYAAAARDYAHAGQLAPRSIEALLGRQQALLALERYTEAEPVGRAVLASDADNYLGTSRLAFTLFNLKHYDTAAALYARLLVLYPSDLEMMTGLGYAELRAGRKREARDTFRALLAISPDHPRARAGLAACR
ncbi:MAG TPA: tetratricopeptide repeat protein [Polyangiaceae bacterium]|nr:tetratricopeptide repeat protein [Polyangiaceae bacterium]